MNFKTIVISAVVTGAVSLLTSFLIYLIQIGGLSLEYTLSETTPFSGESESVAIYRVDVQNSGLKMVEDVSLVIDFQNPKAFVQQSNIDSETVLNSNSDIKDGIYYLDIENLNPNEALTVSLLVTASSSIIASPKVLLRGKNILGKEVEILTEGFFDDIKKNWFTLLLATYAAVIALFAFRRKNPFHVFEKSNQQENFLYYSGIAGLYEELPYFSDPSKVFTYRSESERLTFLAIASKDTDKLNKVKNLFTQLSENVSGMASTSSAIVYYNIARILKFQNNDNEAIVQLKNAYKSSDSIIVQRMKIEKDFWGTINIDKVKSE